MANELLPLMYVSKHIERIADLATKIAEDAILATESQNRGISVVYGC